jgi:uncharacterized protein (DUF433 family)
MADIMVQHIVTTLEVMGGKPSIAGHRIRVLDIVVWHEKRGMSPDEIVDQFPGLTLADVYAALAYYFDHRTEIEEEFSSEEKLVEDLKSHFSSKLQRKLSG